jgi:amino acid adenylation domain-containing protein
MKSAPQKDASAARLELLESVLQNKGISRAAQASRIPKRPEGQAPPLSFAQQRMWFLEQLTPGTAAYNIPAAVHMKGQLDMEALEESLNDVVRRHESLRTTFQVVDEQPVQIVSEMTPVELEVISLLDMEDAEREDQARFIAEQEAQTPFDLSMGLPFRARLLHIGAQEYIFLLTLHHIVSDELSLGILVEELGTIYSSRLANKKPMLPVLPIQYGDYAAWQREWLQGEVLEKQLAYWREQLEGAPAMLELPADHPRSSAHTYAGGQHDFVISEALTEGLTQLGREKKATLFMALLAAFQVLLSRYTGQEDVVVGTPIANRTRRETEPLIGLFVNTLALRSRIQGKESFVTLLDNVRQKSLKAFEHLELPFEKLVEELQPERDQSRTPIFQVMFVMQGENRKAVQLPGLKLTPMPAKTNVAKFDLTCWIQDMGDGALAGNLEYNADLFAPETMARMAEHFKQLMCSIVAAPGQSLAALALMSSAERNQILQEWNLTAAPFPRDILVHEAFEKQAQATPEAVALTWADRSLSYAELNQQANQLAGYLREKEIGPDRLVGICLERSPQMVVAMLGVLKAGGAYVPLDPGYPPERLRYMASDARLALLLTQGELQSLVAELPVETVDLDQNSEAIARQTSSNPDRLSHPANLAYVIYTSGSTGAPKGAMITHEGLMNYLSWCREAYTVERGVGAPVHSSASFDLTVTSIYAPLLSGRTVALAPADLNIENLSNTLRQSSDFSLLKLTPAHLDVLAYSLRPEELAHRAGVLVIGGEALGYETLATWRIHTPETRLINEYGPTETVVGCCIYEVQPQDPFFGPVPIGRPIANTTIYILDSDLEPVPAGIAGNLYIGGAGVARGYLFRPELTAEKFIPDGFSTEPGQRLYDTGDRGRYRADGTIEYLGRADYQVKIRGYRVELGEIETALVQHWAVRESVVVDREDEPGQKRLIGYVVMKEGLTEKPAPAHLRDYLREKLPEYMVPSVIVVLEKLPLTSNGKVDRKSLPRHDRIRNDSDMPRDEVELKLTIIWEQFLHISGIGRRDSFFAVGGHSFMAISLMSKIRDEFGCEIPLAAFFEDATIENTGNLIRKNYEPGAISNVVPIQPNGQQRPVFLVHAISGGALCYLALSRRLGPEQPFYGFQAISSDDLQGERCQSIEERAAHYIEAMKTVQPEGPYLLGGWSFGGYVAYEMARQLVEQGERIALLALLDIESRITSDKANDPGTDTELLIMIAGDSMQQAGQSFDVRFEEIRHLTPDEQIKCVLDSMVRFELLPPEITVSQAREFLQGHRRRGESLRQYQVKPYPGSITLIRGLDPAITTAAPEDPTLGWSNFSSEPVQVYTIPGDHQNLIYPPYVDKLAEVLAFCISQTEAMEHKLSKSNLS